MTATPYLLQLADPDVQPARDAFDTYVVVAESSADALAFVQNFGSKRVWANVTPALLAEATDMTGWKLRIAVFNTDGTTLCDQTVENDGQVEGKTFASDVLTSSANFIGEAKASKTLVSSANYADTETVTVGGNTYTFQASLTNVANNVKVGVDEATSMANLVAAITHGAGSGTAYAAATTANANVTAVTDGVHTITATALAAGTAGNSIVIGETCANAAWAGGATVLSGGTDSETVTVGSNVYTFQNTLTNVAGHVHVGASEAASLANLHHAINGTGGTSGTDYAAATVAHPSVTAADNGSHTVTVTAILAGTAGNSIAATETAASASWAAVTLLGGTSSTGKMSSLAELMAVALNGSGVGISGAAFVDSTHTLTVSSVADNIGDHTISVQVTPPNTDPVSPTGVATSAGTSVPGFVGTITDGGAAGAAITVVFATDTYGIPSLVVRARTQE